jgi:spermidine synthase
LPSESLAAASNTLVYRAQGVHHAITVTSGQRAFELYEDGRLRASTIDSHRYYEALVAPALSAVAAPKRVLMLGGGTGLAEQQVLRNPAVEQVTVICPEPALARVASSLRFLRERNEDALASPRVRLVYDEPARYVQGHSAHYDVILVDAPDPVRFADGAAYSVHFYTRLRRLLAPGGVLAAQAASPFSAPRTFAVAKRSMQAAGLETLQYHAEVPTFGDWGFLLAKVGTAPVVPWETLGPRLQSVRSETLRAFPIDSNVAANVTPSYLYDGHIVEVFAEERAQTGM